MRHPTALWVAIAFAAVASADPWYAASAQRSKPQQAQQEYTTVFNEQPASTGEFHSRSLVTQA